MSALPVSWDVFYAYAKSNELIQLYWKNIAEQNNAGFEVQRSTNALEFDLIAWVPAKGTAPYHYEYNDLQFPEVPLLWYRLKQIDHDGLIAYSKIELVNPQPSPKRLCIFPNPNTQVFLWP